MSVLVNHYGIFKRHLNLLLYLARNISSLIVIDVGHGVRHGSGHVHNTILLDCQLWKASIGTLLIGVERNAYVNTGHQRLHRDDSITGSLT